MPDPTGGDNILDSAEDEATSDQPVAEPMSEDRALGTGPRRVDPAAAQATEHGRPQPASKTHAPKTAGLAKSPAKPAAAKAGAELKKLAKLAANVRKLAALVAAAAGSWQVILGILGVVAVIIAAIVLWPAIEGFVQAIGRGLLGGAATQPVAHQQDDTRVRDLLAATGNLTAIREAVTTSARTAKKNLADLKEKIAPSNPRRQPEIPIPEADRPRVLEQLETTRNAVENLLAAITVEAQQPQPKPGTTNQQSTAKKSRVPGLRTEALRQLGLLEDLIYGGACGTPAPNARGFVMVPNSSNYVIERADAKWGKPRFVCAITKIINEFKILHPGAQVEIYDMSFEDGGQIGRHKSHRRGQDVDIWFGGATPAASWNGTRMAYSASWAVDLAQIIKKYQYGDTWIGFDDCTVADQVRLSGVNIDCSGAYGDHTNHWHLGFRTADDR